MGTTASAEPQHLVIATLLANPALTAKDIAKTLNISTGTVNRVKSRLMESLAKNENGAIELEQYRMQLREQVPATKRVRTIQKAMEMVKTNPFVALRAVDMVDDRLGLTPKTIQQNDIEDNKRPMFVLPESANVQVNIQQNIIQGNQSSNVDKVSDTTTYGSFSPDNKCDDAKRCKQTKLISD